MFDCVIKNGTVIDGSGAAGVIADVAIQDGKIVAVGEGLTGAATVYDASGLVVCPGFIDSHSHSDCEVFAHPEQIEKVEQGITTSVGGQCGGSPWPSCQDGRIVLASDVLSRAAAVPQGSNLVAFVGHRALRRVVIGMEKRQATQEELAKMGDLLRDGIKGGALGISFGLVYTPSCYADTAELIYLAQVAKDCGGMAAAHIRNEGDRLVEAVEEMLEVVKATQVRFVFSHHKAMFRQNHGKVNTTLAMIKQAIDDGADIYCDVYPYIASSTSLASRFIPDAYVNEKLSDSLQDVDLRRQFKMLALEKWGEDLSWVQLTTCTQYPEYSGLLLPEAARLHGKDVYETMFDVIASQPSCGASYFAMDETDLGTVIAWERAMICTDSGVAGNKAAYHPRLRGSFPRALGRYVRERGVVSLPEMIRKMTSLPAAVYGLRNKGRIACGFDADICVFDPDTIIDRADFTNVVRRAEGLRYVFVGGALAAKDAVYTGTKTGRVIRMNQQL